MARHDPRSCRQCGWPAAEAVRRLQADGANALTPLRQRSPWRLLREVAGEPTFQRLLAAGGLYLLLGDLGEALVLLACVLLTALISVWQGLRTERALEALHDLTSPRALVIRDGRPQRIAGVEVVRGDLLVLSEGGSVAASGAARLGPGAQDRVFAGTLVTRSQGQAEVQAISAASC